MTDISALNAGGATARTSGGSAMGAAPMMNQTDFLRLLTTQLTTQDPFNPVDNTQMVAQMAQFSQVAGIAEMNASLKAMADKFGPGRLVDASNWIGRSMLAQGDVATPLRDGSYAGEITLPAAAENVTVSLVDADGAVVHSQELGAQDAGPVAFSWDAKGAATGPLKVVVTARGPEGPILPAIATWTGIAGVQSPANGGAMRLVTGLGLLPPEAALRLA